MDWAFEPPKYIYQKVRYMGFNWSCGSHMAPERNPSCIDHTEESRAGPVRGIYEGREGP